MTQLKNNSSLDFGIKSEETAAERIARAGLACSRAGQKRKQQRREVHGRPHRGKWGQLTPWKMDEKLKGENIQKEQFSEWGWG